MDDGGVLVLVGWPGGYDDEVGQEVGQFRCRSHPKTRKRELGKMTDRTSQERNESVGYEQRVDAWEGIGRAGVWETAL